jgi:hypothetical protein
VIGPCPFLHPSRVRSDLVRKRKRKMSRGSGKGMRSKKRMKGFRSRE